MSTKEFGLLELFLRHPGEVLTRSVILEHVWDFAYDGVSNIIDQYVSYLRRKIDRPYGVEQLETVRGVGYRLRSDPERLRQALDNVLTNAVRHSPDHGVVTLTAESAARCVRISVTDFGPGFAPDFLPHAFERFRRADVARARAHRGAGLGLAIVEAVTTAHRGTVTAANRPEGGAVVVLELPHDG